jgi:lipoprotein-releasing system permease protein
MMNVVFAIALRHLQSGARQSALTIGVVAISVTVMVVLGGLIDGLQRRLINSITGAIPHVVIQQGPRTPPVTPIVPGTFAVEQLIPFENTQRKIEDWQELVATLPSRAAAIVAVSPTVDGQGYLYRGARRKSISVIGMIPERHNLVISLSDKLMSGHFLNLNSGEAVIGIRLALDFKLKIGDKIRIQGSEEDSVGFTIAGIFDSGFRNLDDDAAFVSLRDAQSIFGLGNAVTSVGIKLNNIYAANDVADALIGQTPYDVRSWMRDNEGMLSGLRAQTIFSTLIRLSTVIAAAFSIASILFMSVTSKRREIGILKAIGAKRQQIAGIFALEGALIGVVGGIIGASAGIFITTLITKIQIVSPLSGRLDRMFPVELGFNMVFYPAIIAVAIGLFAALYPARQASNVDPIEVIRGQ